MQKDIGSRRFVVLDRDGTLIEERHYLSDSDGVALIPGSLEAIQQFRSLGLGVILVTNQSAVGRGFFDQTRLNAVHRRLEELLQNGSAHLDGIYMCIHAPEDRCGCRKPEIGMIEQAARDLGFDPASSFVIGDKASDIEFGRRAGATTILVRSGYGADVESTSAIIPDYTVDNLMGAATVIRSLLSD